MPDNIKKSKATLESTDDNRTTLKPSCCKKELFLQFYITGYTRHHGDDDKMFHEAAQTRMNNIKNTKDFDPKKHKVYNIPIQDLTEILNEVEIKIKINGGKSFAKIREIGIFSHSALDGPIGSRGIRGRTQIKASKFASVDYNWIDGKSKRFIMHGCNSANTHKSFAQKISKESAFKDVEIWGQTTSSFPSFFPDKRISSYARDKFHLGYEIDGGGGRTYMVAGDGGEGAKAVLPTTDDATMNPMGVYKNGSLIKNTNQGEFNDHRKNNENLLSK
jgi:hypothetical protein